MAKQLLKTTDSWWVDTEEEAMEMIEEAKENQVKEGYLLSKSGYTAKTKKSKGEVVEMHYVVELTKSFA